jgi:hypothetical protein
MLVLKLTSYGHHHKKRITALQQHVEFLMTGQESGTYSNGHRSKWDYASASCSLNIVYLGK